MQNQDLLKHIGMGTSTLAKMGKNEYVSMGVLVKIYKALWCNIDDIVDVNFEDNGGNDRDK